ncbi:hypothetical protein [Desulfoscipio gibsoniae]|uniref:Uncharacterized protein n=1 Tax=Desulfoscipio gibsoniae DSM 7213 TaxID=767817 RepID=R4KAW2_9FIRM|nr:hypothetical protein [Desulfoscipio gibsoniae]AGL00323.1 hypothetical protein Desgi_0770 [Desulfoscipio gibsoniae DSM 7213]
MSGCGSCSSCGAGDKTREYRNSDGKPAIKCTLCGKEITFDKLPGNRRVTCPECGTDIEVIPLLLN